MNPPEVIDLSHEVHPGIPTWTGQCEFRSHVEMDYGEEGFRVQHYDHTAGIGTHMDGPSHFDPDGEHIANIDVDTLVAPLCVIRVDSETFPDILITPQNVKDYEKAHGKIPPRSLVVADTGWAKHWNNPTKYRNKMHFPGFSPDSIELLLKRRIVGIGIDTLSPDGRNMKFPVHHLLLKKGKYIIENVANLQKVPDSGAWAVALPTKIRNGTEAPCRLIALIYQ